ncbi:MAG: 30S ribosome-binding factor RbfA [Puniceicoccales bacterium]|jgi:ribosome-binding factor A|nr:30S ribosome-binding factor RbfA [Puniceicoccales bacterium]
MDNFRIVRVNELLKRIVSEYLHNTFTSEAVSITITKVETASNLRMASVFFSVYNASARKDALGFLKKIRHSIQLNVSKTVRLKYIPQLTFIWDASVEKAHQALVFMDQLSEEASKRL